MIYGQPEKIGRRKAVKFYIVRKDNLSERGCNAAIQVYISAKNDEFYPDGTLDLIAANYNINTASWRGSRAEAIRVLKEKYTDLKTNSTGYYIDDKRITILQEI